MNAVKCKSKTYPKNRPYFYNVLPKYSVREISCVIGITINNKYLGDNLTSEIRLYAQSKY